MFEVTEKGHAEWLARIGTAWGWVLAMGVVSVLLGLVAIVYPGATLLVIAVIFGVQLIALAVYRFVGALASSGQSGWQNMTSALLAAIAFILGVYLLRHPFLSVLILAVLLGVFWIAYGVFDLFLSLADSAMPGRGWTAVSAILSIVAGVAVLFLPAIALFTVTLVLGAWLVVYGLVLVIRALRLRSQTEYARAHVGGSVSPT
jgi:uncharacterized membrane protein HdeD (DUF308 family)